MQQSTRPLPFDTSPWLPVGGELQEQGLLLLLLLLLQCFMKQPQGVVDVRAHDVSWCKLLTDNGSNI